MNEKINTFFKWVLGDKAEGDVQQVGTGEGYAVGTQEGEHQ